MLAITPSGHKGRRLDSHQHDSAYKADAFLCRATSASRGDRRELNPYLLLHRQACLPRTPRTPYRFQRKGRESNPQGRKAQPASNRIPSPILPFRLFLASQ